MAIIFGTSGNDIKVGTSWSDFIFTGRGNDILDGRYGNDYLFAGRGDDILYGGYGNDKLFGGKGNDMLYGGYGYDKLFGGKGDDFLDGGAGVDVMKGGKGNDTFVWDDSDFNSYQHCHYHYHHHHHKRGSIDGGKDFDVILADNSESGNINLVGRHVKNVEAVLVNKDTHNFENVTVELNEIFREADASDPGKQRHYDAFAVVLNNDMDDDASDRLDVLDNGWRMWSFIGTSLDTSPDIIEKELGATELAKLQQLYGDTLDLVGYTFEDKYGKTVTIWSDLTGDKIFLNGETVGGPVGNIAPVAIDDLHMLTADTAPQVFSGNVLDNDSDPDNGPVALSVSPFGAAGPFESFSVLADGSYTYTFSGLAPDVRALDENGTLERQFNYTVSDGLDTDIGTVIITIQGVNDAPELSDDQPSVSVFENSLAGTIVGIVHAEDPDPGDTITFEIVGGNPGGDGYAIDSNSGAITIDNAAELDLDFDDGVQTLTDLDIKLTDNHGAFIIETVIVGTIAAFNDNAPVFTSQDSISIDENTTDVLTVTATDADLNSSLVSETDTITFSITGGADASLFTIMSSGELAFDSAPDFENPSDTNLDNIYEVIVTADDNSINSPGSSTTDQTILVTVDDVVEII